MVGVVGVKNIFTKEFLKRVEFNSSLKNRRNEIMSLLVFMFKDMVDIKKKIANETMKKACEEAEEATTPYVMWIQREYGYGFGNGPNFGKLPSEKDILKGIDNVAEDINENGETVSFDNETPEKTAQMVFVIRGYYFLKRIITLSETTDAVLSNEFKNECLRTALKALGVAALEYEKDENGNVAFFMKRNIPFSRFFFSFKEEIVVKSVGVKAKGLIKMSVFPDGKNTLGEDVAFSHHNRCKKPTIFHPFDEEKLSKAQYVFVGGKKEKAQIKASIEKKVSLVNKSIDKLT